MQEPSVHGEAKLRRPLQFGMRSLVLSIALAAFLILCAMDTGDTVMMAVIFGIGFGAAFGLGYFVIPLWFRGWSLHVVRGLVFGFLSAPCLVDARCVEIVVPVMSPRFEQEATEETEKISVSSDLCSLCFLLFQIIPSTDHSPCQDQSPDPLSS